MKEVQGEAYLEMDLRDFIGGAGKRQRMRRGYVYIVSFSDEKMAPKISCMYILLT